MQAGDLALVNVPYGGRDVGQSMRPLGLSYLGAFVSRRGIKTQGFDFSDASLSPREIVARYLSGYPIVGLSFYNVNAKLGYQLATEIKLSNPQCIVIVGGPHVSAVHSSLLVEQQSIDIIVRSEGEETLAEVVNAIKNRVSLTGIRGITYRSRGQVVIEPDRERLQDLDDLPAPTFEFISPCEARPLFYFDRTIGVRKRAVALITSRSCPYSCSFCAIILIGRQWRKLSAAKVVSDLKDLEEFRGELYEHVYFLDANFFVSAARAVEIAEALHSYRPSLTFSFSTRVNQLIKGRRLISQLRQLGLRAVELGIESGNDNALRRFAKDTTVRQNNEALEILNENRIQLFLDFIMFDAEETVEELNQNIEFIYQNNLDSYIPWDHLFSYMTPYVGTEIRRHYEQLKGYSFETDELPDPADLFEKSRR